jgi:hypothetical protein
LTCSDGSPAADSAAIDTNIRRGALSMLMVMNAIISDLGLRNVLFPWHQVGLKLRMRRDILQLMLPVFKIILCIVQYLTGLIAVLVSCFSARSMVAANSAAYASFNF